MLRLACLLAASLLAGCGEAPLDITVQAYNDSAEAVEVRFRATSEDGDVVTEVTSHVPPGYSVLGEVAGSPGRYRLEAWALGEHAELDAEDPVTGTVCSVYVANPTPLRIGCVPEP